MSSATRLRDVRQHDGCPASYRTRSGAVGVGSVPTLDALKDRLRRPVGLRDMPAIGTLSTCVARVNEEDAYARSFSLVGQKGTELPEGPARESSALLPSSPHPQAYARQILQGYSSLRAFGKLDNLFADNVVGVAGETLLFAREFLEAASGGVRALLLKLRSEPPVAMPDAVDRFPTTDIPIGVGSDILHAQIHSDDAFGYERLRVFDLARREQIELATPVHEVGFSRAGFEQLHLPLSGNKRNNLPGLIGIHRPEGYGRFAEVPRQNPVIVGDGAIRSEAPLAPLIKAVGVSDFGEAPDHHLSRQAKLILSLVVADLLKRVLPKRPLVPRSLGDTVAGRVGAGKRIFQEASLLFRRTELQLGYELHILKVYHDHGDFAMGDLRRGSDSSSLLKQEASSEQVR